MTVILPVDSKLPEYRLLRWVLRFGGDRGCHLPMVENQVIDSLVFHFRAVSRSKDGFRSGLTETFSTRGGVLYEQKQGHPLMRVAVIVFTVVVRREI